MSDSTPRQIIDDPDELTARLRPVVEDMDLELVELSLKGPTRRRYLELLVHRIGGATTGDCTALARHVRDLVDNEGLLEPDYQLSVATPGLDRPLRTAQDFRRYPDMAMRVFLKEPHEGKREVHGKVTLSGEAQLTIAGKKRSFELPLEQVDYAKLVV